MSEAIPYGRHWLDEADVSAVEEALRSDRITQGPRVDGFERALADYCGARHAVATSSGTAALHLACLAAGLGPSDEVVTTPMTFVATSNSVLFCGATPRFADIQADTRNIDPERVAATVTDRTRAIIPVHFAGHPCDMDEIAAIAKESDLVVIEDACHALGASYRGGRIGACEHSDMAVLSFHPVKHITTGEGGAVLTNDDALCEGLRRLREHGISRDPASFRAQDPASDGPWYYEMQELGYNYRITDIQCALGSSQLDKADAFLARRREIAAAYAELLADVPGLRLPAERDYVSSSWHIHVVELEDPSRRKAVFEDLLAAGLGVQVHYLPVHLHPYYARRFGHRLGDLPVAESYYRRAITIPLFPSMTDEEVEAVAAKVREAL